MYPIKLPRAVCNALDDLVAENFTNYQIIYLTAQSEWTSAEYMCLNSQDVNDIMRALVVGYEPELTPEERIKDLYDKSGFHPESMFTKGYQKGVEDTLKAHGIYYDWLGGFSI